MKANILVLALAACHGGGDSDATDPPLPDSADLCARLAPGPADPRAAVLGLSDAHSAARLFGMEGDFSAADGALAAALGGDLDAPDLDAYAARVTDVCARSAGDGVVGAARVDLVGAHAWVHPGAGPVVLPDGATAVVLDLRGLPADIGEAMLIAAVSPALSAPVSRAPRRSRVWSGYVDQVFSADNPYTVDVEALPVDDIPAGGAADLPLFIVNDATMAPAATAITADLVMSARARVVGHDVRTAIGEMRWFGIGDRGLAVRVADHADWPDELPAFARTDDPEALLAGLDPASLAMVDPVIGAHERAVVAPRAPFGETVGSTLDRGTMRADLVTVHGAIRAFWRYFPIVGDTVDARLVEVLGSLGGDDRREMVVAMGRLGECLHDGHVFFADYGGTPPAGYAAVTFDHLADGSPVVRGSAVADVHLGDALIAVDGRPIAAVYAELLAWHGAATDGYARDMASRALVELDGPVTWTLRDPDGAVRDVVITPGPADALYGLPWGPTRENGTLADLGAPDIAYVNLDGGVTTAIGQVNAVIAAASGAAGLVVDMRGYPAVDHYDVAKKLIHGSFASPRFLTTVLSGPGAVDVLAEQYSLGGTKAFTAPVVLLVGPRSVSAAENFATMLVGADAVRVVGRNSAGTNGNITGLMLPGEVYFSFTGMEVQYPDGTAFHGTGIVPDVAVPLAAADLRDGRDADLAAAIAALR